MSNVYVPEVGPKVIPAHVEERIVNGIVNRPVPGTRMRVTMPGTETVLVGVVTDRESPYELIDLAIEGGQGHFQNDITLWVESGWKFEILPPLAVPADAERDLVNA